MASTTSICSMTFAWFINDVWTEPQRGESSMNNAWIVIDNWSVHKSKNVKDFVKNRGIRWITIPTYSPQLNAVEKAIAVIKGKLRKKWIASKKLSLNLVRKIVDSMGPEICNWWITSSRFETFKKMKTLKIGVSWSKVKVQ